MTRADRELFDRALFRQKNNRIQAAIKVWKQFLQKHPRSFEAHNNLGLIYFEDDQVDPSIAEFETALSLEPNDAKIKKNLIRVLKFKATLLNEAKDYNGAVDTLKRAQEISTPRGKEKIGFIIEKFEDKVFEQAKQTNTVEAYEGFLNRFPKSTKNADEARMKIEGLKPRSPETVETAMDDLKEEEPSSTASLDEKEVSESDSPPESSMVETGNGDGEQEPSVMDGSTGESADKGRTDEEGSAMNDVAGQARETTGKGGESPLIESLNKEIIPEHPQEAVRGTERPIEIASQPEPKPSTGADLFSNLEQEESATQEPEVSIPPMEDLPRASPPPKKIVEIITRKDPLRVREGPSLNSRVLATVAKGSQVPFVTERDGWYKVEFSVGQMGWVSKKFSRLME